jgi:hypothetical protein
MGVEFPFGVVGLVGGSDEEIVELAMFYYNYIEIEMADCQV